MSFIPQYNSFNSKIINALHFFIIYLTLHIVHLQVLLGSQITIREQFPGSYVTEGQVELSGWKILKSMWGHIWPRDKPSLKARVVAALGLLIGAKV